jgi:hypothetical protein
MCVATAIRKRVPGAATAEICGRPIMALAMRRARA